jgi:hypothetical protein
MNLAPRQEYGLGSIVKSVKKAVSGAAKGIKSFAKSDVGKMALLLGGGYLAGGGGMPSFLGGRGLGGFQFSNLPGASLFSKSSAIGGPKYNLGGFSAIGANKSMSGLTKGLLGGGALSALLGAAEAGDQEAITATRDIGALKGYLSSYYENLGYKEEEIPAMVERDTAEYSSAQGGYANGGRIGAMYGGRMKYADGSEDIILPMKKPETEEMIFSNPGAAESGNPVTRNEPIANLIDKYNTYKKAMPGVADETRTYLIEDFKKSLEDSGVSTEEFMMRLQEQGEMDEPVDMAKGGRIGYALGSDEIVDQASGIMGLPKRTNKAGVKELDLRDSGGFIPPVGVKEKADDVPAMLSNNEFVFTADAVRGMGDGNVNKGAQRMYDMMKKLENGGRV